MKKPFTIIVKKPKARLHRVLFCENSPFKYKVETLIKYRRQKHKEIDNLVYK